jgi:hypothetical protein
MGVGSHRAIVVAAISLAVLISLGLTVAEQGTSAQEADSEDTFDMDALVAKVQQSIEGKEEMPAEEVFENIEILNGIPAGRVPMIMKFGFSRSLGVDCRHCHNVEKLASNENPKKQVARDMWGMVANVNKQIMEIPNLESKRPVVNCTTCHRGDKQPATNME